MQLRRVRMTHFALTLALSTALACAAFGAMAAFGHGRRRPEPGLLHRQHLTGVGAEGQLHDVRRRDGEHVDAGKDHRCRGDHPAARLPGDRRVPAHGRQGARVRAGSTSSCSTTCPCAPGSTLHVAVTATAPSRCNTRFTRWFTVATGGLFGELMFPDSSSSLTTNVTCANPAAGVDFVTQPTNSTVTQDITPPVTVQLVDSGGNPVATSGVSVTLALGNNSGSGTLSGTLTEPTNASGVATFSDLSINQPGFGYTLTASSTGLTGATSNPFSESNSTSTTCTTSPCTTDLGTSVSDLEISADASAGTINESVDVGSPLTVPTRESRSTRTFISSRRPAPPTRPSATSCSASTATRSPRFRSASGRRTSSSNSNGGEAASGTLPDGSPGFVDLLPNCCDADFEGIGPCVDTTEPYSDDTSGLQVTVDVPGMLVHGCAGRPWMHG